jgi:acyl-CoA synthetase (AMP-forming)/AMP-acid ligase II
MLGYWGRPEESAATVADGWLHTGDIGYLDKQGYLFIVDRKKDMIVTGGSNVYAREVEEVLLQLPGIREAAVVGIPHRVWGEAVTAVLVPSDGRRDSEAVIAGCKAVLAGYRVPKDVVWVEQLPRNAYGKVLKRRLRDTIGGTGAR